MKFTGFTTILIFTVLGYSNLAHAQPQPVVYSQATVPTKAEILDACIRNQAETLPNPYTDVEPTHWAYKAVLSMYYCGAFRQATPPALIEQLLQSDQVPVQESDLNNRDENQTE